MCLLISSQESCNCKNIVPSPKFLLLMGTTSLATASLTKAIADSIKKAQKEEI